MYDVVMQLPIGEEKLRSYTLSCITFLGAIAESAALPMRVTECPFSPRLLA